MKLKTVIQAGAKLYVAIDDIVASYPDIQTITLTEARNEWIEVLNKYLEEYKTDDDKR
jgi:hypothetical protein